MIEQIEPIIFVSKAPLIKSEDEIKCPYVKCAWGMGLAGRLVCEAGGNPASTICDKYDEEQDF